MLDNNTASEKLIEECLIDMLKIAADAKKEAATGIITDDCFACFTSAFTPVSILMDLNPSVIEIVAPQEIKEEEKEIEEFEEGKFEEGKEEDKIPVSANTFKFLNIMNKNPENISQEDKREAFELFPEAFQFIRVGTM
ncbi:hypothetical protein [Methanosarcina sp. UBA289]|uniref:hypothetical protein n=1 Tax=Methanosarcina sp. UBA289 TaxID=1915574 RepID=UPI0025F8C390|nr:hypothetical protein [Methanosarcina sp. UBA289]